MKPIQTVNFQRLLPVCFLLSLLFGSGCTTSTGKASATGMPGWERQGPFAVKLASTASWTKGETQGFDSELPGYHLTGDITSLQMVAVAEKPPESFVLAITTSPGQEPHLDHFRISFPGGTIECEPFNARTPARIATRNLERNASVYEPRENFFDFQVRDSAVHVIFKPRAILMLGGESTISWIDWYRN